ncbi:hypothetical protein BCR34DRAFT_597674 [Clohesyomyces aquaticus]|uniref:1-alkyl-2-acetylglycerophosphocholine esterase n=1 Tax=Clohesyomyces aquaticus TaxID=1231657 RepID=A0A1Y2A1K4_9PLEO|nr:hypothetical protein BCR34DRAFT_597674 [Clohesyomyces aquaticus]
MRPQLSILLSGFALVHPTLSSLSTFLPNTSGKDYGVALSHHTLHSSIPDPYAPDPTLGRYIQISIFYPVQNALCSLPGCVVPYMPHATAKLSDAQFFGGSSGGTTGVLESLELEVCCNVKADSTFDVSQFPVVFIEGNVGTSRHLYTCLAREIASHEYVVITIDHAYDSSIIDLNLTSTLNTGQTSTTIHQSISLSPFTKITTWNSTISTALRTRLSDLEFLASTLSSPSLVAALFTNSSTSPNNTISPIFPAPGSAFNTSRLNILGHGLGGTVATTLALLPTANLHPAVAINMAGTTPGAEEDIVNTAPILFFGFRPGGTRYNDTRWNTSFPHFENQATEWDLRNGDIFSYSDLPLLADLKGLEQGGVKGTGRVGKRAWDVMTSWCTAYLDLVWRWKSSETDRAEVERRLNLLMNAYPEMEIFPGEGDGKGVWVWEGEVLGV